MNKKQSAPREVFLIRGPVKNYGESFLKYGRASFGDQASGWSGQPAFLCENEEQGLAWLREKLHPAKPATPKNVEATPPLPPLLDPSEAMSIKYDLAKTARLVDKKLLLRDYHQDIFRSLLPEQILNNLSHPDDKLQLTGAVTNAAAIMTVERVGASAKLYAKLIPNAIRSQQDPHLARRDYSILKFAPGVTGSIDEQFRRSMALNKIAPCIMAVFNAAERCLECWHNISKLTPERQAGFARLALTMGAEWPFLNGNRPVTMPNGPASDKGGYDALREAGVLPSGGIAKMKNFCVFYQPPGEKEISDSKTL
jgi:hypothetical protein